MALPPVVRERDLVAVAGRQTEGRRGGADVRCIRRGLLHARLLLSALSAVALTGCAALACAPITVTVVEKQKRVRLDDTVRGLRTNVLGLPVEDRRTAIVRDYWIKDASGAWCRLDEPAGRAATVGESATVCP